MAHTEQEFYVGETVYVREDIDDMPYGYMSDMKRLRGKTVTINCAHCPRDGDDWVYRVAEDRAGFSWHAMCFSKIESTLPEFESGTVSDLLNMFE